MLKPQYENPKEYNLVLVTLFSTCRRSMEVQ